MESVYRSMLRRIQNKYYATREEAILDMDKLLNKGHLTQEEYDALIVAIDEIYN